MNKTTKFNLKETEILIKQDKNNFYMLNWLDEFMAGHNGFICGGCFKNIFNHEKVKDLDIFFKSEQDFNDAILYFDRQTVGYNGKDKKEEAYRFYYENDNVKAYKHIESNITIELCCKIFGSPKDILNQFDFTITKFAYYKEEVDDLAIDVDNDQIAEIVGTHTEYKILMDNKFFEHLHLKRLVIDNAIPFPMGTFERVLRYAKYGYFPCRETKMKIIQAIRSLTDEQVELSNSLYDGMD